MTNINRRYHVPVTETQRHALHRTLREALGGPMAEILMEHLPPAGWGDVVRRADLEQMQSTIVSALTEKVRSQTRWFVGLFAAQYVVLLALVVR